MLVPEGGLGGASEGLGGHETDGPQHDPPASSMSRDPAGDGAQSLTDVPRATASDQNPPESAHQVPIEAIPLTPDEMAEEILARAEEAPAQVEEAPAQVEEAPTQVEEVPAQAEEVPVEAPTQVPAQVPAQPEEFPGAQSDAVVTLPTDQWRSMQQQLEEMERRQQELLAALSSVTDNSNK